MCLDARFTGHYSLLFLLDFAINNHSLLRLCNIIMCSPVTGEGHVWFWCINLRERGHFEDVGLHGRII